MTWILTGIGFVLILHGVVELEERLKEQGREEERNRQR